MDSLYYRVFLKDQKSIVFFVAILRSLHENLVFDRIEKKKEYTFELFLNQSGEAELLEILKLLIKKKYY
ncbi:hypothetical protein E6Q11_05515 [Candidatus Dojkabacteria bacterium]|uniref:Uncharacterized protein n=1 Tax=Candidatus Dojkabacteria bacterium TaxID=2099670 RepID=A0A5C7J3J1_9BACT|nr:MAG: hypothetical protein E6Q11_05515 [Candidatus Dojkabacteria bacterium]